MNQNGKLEPVEMAPIIIGFMPPDAPPLTEEQCLAFTAMFDRNGDNVIDRLEFFYLVEFVIVQQIMMQLQQQQQQQQQIEAQAAAIPPPAPSAAGTKVAPAVRAQLPPQLQELLASEQFATMCAQQVRSICIGTVGCPRVRPYRTSRLKTIPRPPPKPDA